MADPVAVGALALSVTHAAVSAVVAVRRRRARQANFKTVDVRRALAELRRVTGDVVALGGADTDVFGQEPVRLAEADLDYLVTAVTEAELGRLCAEALRTWKLVFATAPSPPGPLGGHP
jgi:hypothetical protein